MVNEMFGFFKRATPEKVASNIRDALLKIVAYNTIMPSSPYGLTFNAYQTIQNDSVFQGFDEEFMCALFEIATQIIASGEKAVTNENGTAECYVRLTEILSKCFDEECLTHFHLWIMSNGEVKVVYNKKEMMGFHKGDSFEISKQGTLTELSLAKLPIKTISVSNSGIGLSVRLWRYITAANKDIKEHGEESEETLLDACKGCSTLSELISFRIHQ